MFREPHISLPLLSAFRRGLAIFLVGVLLVTYGCTQHVSKPSSDFDDVAYLSVYSPSLFGRIGGLVCPFFQAELFAVDQKRVIDRQEIVLEPGQHEVEFRISWSTQGYIGVRTLRFDAVAGKSYQLGVGDIAGDPCGGSLVDLYPGYWIRDRETDKIVVDGNGHKDQKGIFGRQWYVDEFKGRIGNIPSNDGEATVIVHPESSLRAKIGGAREIDKTVEGGEIWGGEITVPAGQVVIEAYVLRHSGIRSNVGRIVIDLRPGKRYSIEEEETFPGRYKFWITETATKKKVGKFHSCWTWLSKVTSFSDCEDLWGAKIEYADIKPGDPRFWWGPSGRDF